MGWWLTGLTPAFQAEDPGSTPGWLCQFSKKYWNYRVEYNLTLFTGMEWWLTGFAPTFQADDPGSTPGWLCLFSKKFKYWQL